MKADEFKAIRVGMGLSQMQMAVRADVSIGTVQSLEAGTLRPEARTKGKLATAYGVSPEQITFESRRRKPVAA